MHMLYLGVVPRKHGTAETAATTKAATTTTTKAATTEGSNDDGSNDDGDGDDNSDEGAGERYVRSDDEGREGDDGTDDSGALPSRLRRQRSGQVAAAEAVATSCMTRRHPRARTHARMHTHALTHARTQARKDACTHRSCSDASVGSCCTFSRKSSSVIGWYLSGASSTAPNSKRRQLYEEREKAAARYPL